MRLPYLKNKLPRVNSKPQEEKLVNGDAEDLIDDRCMDEMLDALEHKDKDQFRYALEALILNMFERKEDHAA